MSLSSEVKQMTSSTAGGRSRHNKHMSMNSHPKATENLLNESNLSDGTGNSTIIFMEKEHSFGDSVL